MRSGAVTALLAAAAAVALASAATAATLDRVKAAGHVRCGVSEAQPGFSNIDDRGNWRGLNVDICRAISAAVFGDANKVQYKPLQGKDGFKALQAGDIDLLARNSSWTMSRDTTFGLNFAAVIYYDGLGFMVRRQLGIASVLELSQASICGSAGVAVGAKVAEFFGGRKMPYEMVAFDNPDEALQAYDSGRCDAFAADASQLYALRLKLPQPDAHMVLPEIVSKEPHGPAVRQGDDPWFDIVKWAVFALVNAEELGVTSANIDDMRRSDNPEVRRLLGLDGAFGQTLGLDDDWAYNIIRLVGNYGEIFERNVGQGSPLRIARGVNALWNRGGILYAPPIR